MIKVEIFALPGCTKCVTARQSLCEVIDEVGVDKCTWREVNLLDEIGYAVELGVVSTPSWCFQLYPALTHCARRSTVLSSVSDEG